HVRRLLHLRHLVAMALRAGGEDVDFLEQAAVRRGAVDAVAARAADVARRVRAALPVRVRLVVVALQADLRRFFRRRRPFEADDQSLRAGLEIVREARTVARLAADARRGRPLVEETSVRPFAVRLGLFLVAARALRNARELTFGRDLLGRRLFVLDLEGRCAAGRLGRLRRFLRRLVVVIVGVEVDVEIRRLLLRRLR